MRWPWAWGLAVALGGCAFTPTRVQPTLRSAGELAFSNSPMVFHPRQPHSSGQQLRVVYSFLVENVGTQPDTLVLSQATQIVTDHLYRASCAVAGHAWPELLIARAA